MDQLNVSKKDLTKILGSNRVSGIFSGKGQLSLFQVKKLRKELHIPTDLLLGVQLQPQKPCGMARFIFCDFFGCTGNYNFSAAVTAF